MSRAILPGQVSLFDMLEQIEKRDCFRCVFFESHRCSNRWVCNEPCPDGMKFAEYTGSEVKQCILATVEIYQDGYMHCPVLDCYGCDYCYKRLEDDDFVFYRDDTQNYHISPRWKERTG